MTPRRAVARSWRFPQRLVVLFCIVAAACDRQGGAGSAPQPGQSPHTAPSSTQPSAEAANADDTFLIKLAVLHHLMVRQPLDADRAAYAGYLIKDASAGRLAASLKALLGSAGPPVIADGAADVYTRKGRTMDRATGRPMKVFVVRVAEPTPDQAEGPVLERRAQAVASWQAGRLAKASFHCRLRKEGSSWVVVECMPAAR